MNCKANQCIRCTVKECANHCTDTDYCALDSIMIGTHEANPTQAECTDCQSFLRK